MRPVQLSVLTEVRAPSVVEKHPRYAPHWDHAGYNTFSTSGFDEGKYSASHSGRFTLGERTHGNCWARGWADPTADLDAVTNINTCSGREWNPGPPANRNTAQVMIFTVKCGMSCLQAEYRPVRLQAESSPHPTTPTGYDP